VRFLPLALVAVAVFVFVLWPAVSSQFRLSRNGASARQLVESLHASFPAVNFRGAASYEREVIYISVLERVDAPVRAEIEQWLRQEKQKRKIGLEIRLQFAGDDLDDIKL
jgi:hypothetical protein